VASGEGRSLSAGVTTDRLYFFDFADGAQKSSNLSRVFVLFRGRNGARIEHEGESLA
jgi:hypothetical protein